MENYTYESSSNVNGCKSSTFTAFGEKLTIWDVYEPKEIEDVNKQLDLITTLSSNYDDVVKHLKINGFDVSKF